VDVATAAVVEKIVRRAEIASLPAVTFAAHLSSSVVGGGGGGGDGWWVVAVVVKDRLQLGT